MWRVTRTATKTGTSLLRVSSQSPCLSARVGLDVYFECERPLGSSGLDAVAKCGSIRVGFSNYLGAGGETDTFGEAGYM